MAARFYLFNPGSPGYISAEVAVRELFSDHDEARAWAEDSWAPAPDQRIISRAEATMLPLYREALDAWEQRDDRVMQSTEVEQILDSRRREVAYFADLGCRGAAAALAVGTTSRSVSC